MTQSERTEELAKAYDPSKVEGPLYQMWLDRGYFKPRVDSNKEPFCIIMPPPNVTGELHLGHALTATIEDCLVRWHRMLGDPTLWLPGVDHAGIATQNVVEKQLAKEGLSRHDLGREQFLERVWQWVRKYRGVIANQHARLGTSCDWDREVFTMDEGPQKAVRTTFVKLYDEGLIYRGERIINWCPRCQTALSDLEVEHEETDGSLWYVRYPLLDDAGNMTDDYVVMATTRPETIVADVAVAVNPTVERWRNVVGRNVLLPIIERHIPVIQDEAIEAEFGTGALKVTPGHDPVDFEIAQRHRLPAIIAINGDGSMNAEAGPYEGMDRFDTRKTIVADLERLGLIEKVEPHRYSLGHCERCGTVVEPLLSKQWFVKMDPLAKPAIEVVKDRRISIIPRRFERVYMHWMENIRDWCISRQLWWGHRIPVWYCASCGEQTASVEDPAGCPKCDSQELEQDPDVLDTWFSSALWPHSTLGWPNETEDLRYWYPTSVLETGYDILFFWVARMIMMGVYNMQEEPFRHVYLHGLIRDAQGRKMTKSLGNVMDPLELIDKYGCDALRFALATGAAPGNDFRLSDERLESGRNFANKIWNASRLVIGHLDNHGPVDKPTITSDMSPEDQWILGLINVVTGGIESVRTYERDEAGQSRWVPGYHGVNQLLQDFQINEAAQRLYDFFWHSYCDWYLELAKLRLRAGDLSPLPVMASVLDTSLRLLHPFMPFVTEAAWQHLARHMSWVTDEDALIVARWPQKEAQMEAGYRQSKEYMDVLQAVIQAIRDSRTVAQIAPSLRIPLAILELAPAIKSAETALQGLRDWRFPESDAIGRALLESQAQFPERIRDAIQAMSEAIKQLARVQSIELLDTFTGFDNSEFIPTNAGPLNVYVQASNQSWVDDIREHLNRRLREVSAAAQRSEAKMANLEFLEKAPREVVAKEAEKMAAAQAQVDELVKQLAELE